MNKTHAIKHDIDYNDLNGKHIEYINIHGETGYQYAVLSIKNDNNLEKVILHKDVFDSNERCYVSSEKIKNYEYEPLGVVRHIYEEFRSTMHEIIYSFVFLCDGGWQEITFSIQDYDGYSSPHLCFSKLKDGVCAEDLTDE
jgi:hypothetical protein